MEEDNFHSILSSVIGSTADFESASFSPNLKGVARRIGVVAALQFFKLTARVRFSYPLPKSIV